MLNPTPVRQSVFVTVIAWLGIISGILATLGGLMMLAVTPGMRPVVTLAGGVMALAAAIGLRRRRNWARLGFIAVLALSVVNGLINAFRVSGVPDINAAEVRNYYLAWVLGFGVINGLIIAKLCTARVRAEFDAD